jgi:hypothetical protein
MINDDICQNKNELLFEKATGNYLKKERLSMIVCAGQFF